MKTLIVIPAHNEAAAIGALVAKLRALGHDCVVIDDGSLDETADLAQKAGAVVLQTKARSGKGNALKMGFDYALSRRYEAVITMDGDGQHAAADIAAFEEACRRTGADIISGSRMQNPKGMPWVRLATNRFMSWLISVICRQPVADTQCGFRLIKAGVLQSIRLESSDFEIETEVLVKASKKGFKIVSVAIQTIYSNEVSKIRPVQDTFRFIAYLGRELGKKA